MNDNDVEGGHKIEKFLFNKIVNILNLNQAKI